MTDDELAAIEARASKATPGPWTQELMYVAAAVPQGRPNGEVIIQCYPTVRHLNDVVPVKRNAEFVAHARADVPALVTEVRRLREVERIAVETLNHIARCGCKACGPALPDMRAARTLADDALTRMDTVE